MIAVARRGEAHGAARPPSEASHFGAQLSQEVAHRVLDRAAVLDEELGVELGVGEAHLGEVTQPGLVLRRRGAEVRGAEVGGTSRQVTPLKKTSPM